MRKSKSPLKIKKIIIWLIIAYVLIISYLGVRGFFTAFHRVASLENCILYIRTIPKSN